MASESFGMFTILKGRSSFDAGLDVAERAGVPALEIEVICSDVGEHRKRIETRAGDIADLKLPTWNEVVAREYETWEREHIVIETAGRTLEGCVQTLREHFPTSGQHE
jgi:predicted kinase